MVYLELLWIHSRVKNGGWLESEITTWRSDDIIINVFVVFVDVNNNIVDFDRIYPGLLPQKWSLIAQMVICFEFRT